MPPPPPRVKKHVAAPGPCLTPPHLLARSSCLSPQRAHPVLSRDTEPGLVLERTLPVCASKQAEKEDEPISAVPKRCSSCLASVVSVRTCRAAVRETCRLKCSSVPNTDKRTEKSGRQNGRGRSSTPYHRHLASCPAVALHSIPNSNPLLLAPAVPLSLSRACAVCRSAGRAKEFSVLCRLTANSISRWTTSFK